MADTDIVALINACRAAGVTHLKTAEVEFTLAVDHRPTVRSKPARRNLDLPSNAIDQAIALSSRPVSDGE